MFEYNWFASYKRWRRFWNQESNRATIELPNGAHCNADFYWHCVDLGIISMDD